MSPSVLDAVRAYARETSPLCFTTDIEWSPDWAIRDLFELADRSGVPLTPFLTHRSRYLAGRLRRDDDVGLHPNFLTGSTHGGTVEEVITTVRALWPDAVSFRAHCFYDETRMLRKMAMTGIRYDANQLAFLAPMLAPFRTVAGTVRFPVFWEDDVHSSSGLEWELGSLRDALASPGLKIVNVHPLHVALNVPDEAFYESRRALYASPADTDPRDHAHRGKGTRTLLEDLFAYSTSDGRRPVRLADLYETAVEQGIAADTP
ncbi:MAG: hypothetical protein Q7S41_03135 [Candidatus Limnocylindria bacterium]|nr:hypothetical protein [Candidatus Limnocylindria bacterium]